MEMGTAVERRGARRPGYTAKTFTGCWSCRRRKVKCDERVPSCTPCEKIGRPCAGYQQKLVWVEPDQKSYQAEGRRYMDPYTTWDGHPTLSSRRIDRMIQRCDIGPSDELVRTVSCPPFFVFDSQSHDDDPVDSSEESSRDSVSPPLEDFHDTDLIIETYGTEKQEELQIFTSDLDAAPETGTLDSTPVLTLGSPKTCPSLWPTLNTDHMFLLEYYVCEVVPVMTPVNGDENPWARYPGIAFALQQYGRSHFLHAMLAHSAFFKANNNGHCKDTLALGATYYNRAMAEVRADINSGNANYVGLLMSMLAFVIIELVRGDTKTWRTHYNAAWKLLQQRQQVNIRTVSNDLWYMIQSLCLFRTQYDNFDAPEDTVITESEIGSNEMEAITAQISADPRFGCTIGASSFVMDRILQINKRVRERRVFGWSIDGSDIREELLEFLLTTDENFDHNLGSLINQEPGGLDLSLKSDKAIAEHLHQRATTAASIIYYHQCLDEKSPYELETFVSQVLDCLSAFYVWGGSNCTIWPLFIAGVEIYRQEQMDLCMTLFDRSQSHGIANRLKARDIVERVWQLRQAAAFLSSKDAGLVRVDWRRVMREQDYDIILL